MIETALTIAISMVAGGAFALLYIIREFTKSLNR